MYKVIKKIVKLFLYFIVIVPLVPIIIWAVMLLPGVQDNLLNKALTLIHNETGSTISYSRAGFTGVSRISFEDLLILHPNGDTIVYSKEASFAAAALYQLFFTDNPNLAVIRKLQFDRSVFNLAMDSVGKLNLQFLIDYLESKIDTTDTTPPSGKPFRIKTIQITNSVFTLKEALGVKRPNGINFNDLRCNDLNINVKDLTIIRDTVRMDIKMLAFKEKSGFVVNNLSAFFELCKHHLNFSDVKVTTPFSNVNTHKVFMSFEKYKDFKVKTLYQKIFFGFAFYETRLNLKDLGYFVDFFKDADQEVDFAGNFNGPISKFKSEDFTVGWGESSVIQGKFKIDGLPKIRETFFIVDFNEISTSVAELTSLKLPRNYQIVLPENLQNLNYIYYKGNYTGFINDFVSKGHFTTNLGDLYTDIMIVPDSLNRVSFQGKINSKNFQLGTVIGIEKTIGKISGNAAIKGVYVSKERIEASVKAQISEFFVKDYNYQNIDVDANLRNKKISGKISVNDPNLIMEAEGHLDFGIDESNYVLKTNIIDANLYALNISKVDSTFHASCLAETNLYGKSIDSLNGEIKLINSLFTKSDRQIQVYDLNIDIINSENHNRIVLYSDILDADISGRYQLSNLKNDFMVYLSNYISKLTQNSYTSIENGIPTQIEVYAKLKRSQAFFDFFFPKYFIAENTIIKGSYSSGKQKFLKVDVNSPVFRYGKNTINGLVVNISSDDSAIYSHIGSQEINLNNRIRFENVTFMTETGQNRIDFVTRWLNWDTAVYKGKISGNIMFGGTDTSRSYHLSFDPSEIIIHDSIWKLSSSNIHFEDGKISVDNFSVKSNDEILMTHGLLSDMPGDSLYFDFINFNLAYINFFTKRQGVEFIGKLNGKGYLLGLKNPLFFTSTSIDNLIVNGEELGLCSLNSIWDNEKQSLKIGASAQRGKLTVLNINGDYFPERNGKMDFQISLNKLKTDVFNPFLPGVFSNIRGLMSGDLELTGITGKPSLSGKIKLQKNAFTINYLKTRYNFTTDLEIVSNNFILNKIEVFDQYGNSAIVNGIIKTEYLRNIDLNLNISAKNLLCLNTGFADNKMYYGTAFASGNIKIKGRPSALHFDIDATTEKDTRFYIPLSEGTNVSDFNYIRYIRNDTEQEDVSKVEKQFHVNLSGIQMDFNLHVTPEAEVQIIFDSKMGDIIKARGAGEIQMSINTLGTFDMVGEYVIQEGDYLFTLQKVINKKLEIQPGSALRWSGDPLNAQIDVTAVYRRKVSLTPLFPNDSEKEYQGNATVDCQAFLTGGLQKPVVKYDIDLPYAQEEVKEKVKSKISSDEEKTKQILSIIIMGQFIPQEGSQSELSGKYAPGMNASELLSNQLSNWLSQISNDFDLGVNYRPGSGSGSEMSSSEVEVALSTQLFNDRLSINGSYDMRSNATTDKAKNVVDVDLDYKLNKSGNLRARAYNRPNDDQAQTQTTSTTYTTGLGIFYMEEFSSFKELMNKYWNFITGKSKKKSAKDSDIDAN
jgi:hypothetical protein